MYRDGSYEFNSAIDNTTGNALVIRLVMSDGKEISDIKGIVFNGGSNTTDDIAIGTTNMSYLDLEFEGDFIVANQEIELQAGVLLSDDTYEWLPIGKFIMQSSKGTDEVSVKAVDFMYKFEQPYASSLSYPTTSDKVLKELCEICGVVCATTISEPITITDKLSGYTCREMLGYIAGIHGCFACFDRYGQLHVRWYDEDSLVEKETEIMWEWEPSQVEYVLGKVELHKDSETSYTSGSGVRGIIQSNPFATQEITDNIYERIGGFSYYPASIDMLDDVRIDPWDIIKVTDSDGNEFKVPCMGLIHDFTTVSTSVESYGKSEIENEYNFQGPYVQAMQRLATDLAVINTVLATTVKTEELQAEVAKLGFLTANEVNALVAKFGYVNADEVNAIIGNFGYITSTDASLTYATISELDATKGRVGELETNSLTANSAIIKSLDAEVGKINTLIFGSATGDSIQTTFSNSVIAQLGDAQIKSAMIESLSADKITSGSIYTNKVYIYGDDTEKLSIIDNTIAITDGTNTRVQIGKDSEGDYNMYVWDSNGNLMFDALGLTEDGITRKVIRDDVVMDNANISASKLNIDSLFSEINGSTNTIKSTQIYVDDEGQTLNLAFKTLSTTANETKDKIDNLEIGGRNFLRNSDFTNGTTNWSGPNSTTVSIDQIEERKCLAIDSSTSTNATFGYATQRATLELGTKYTVSAKVYTPIDANIRLSAWYDNSGWKTLGSSGNISLPTGWNEVSWTFTTNDTYSTTIVGFSTIKADNTIVYIYHPQLEKGTVVTDWTLAPEDVEQSISTVESTVTSQGTEISVIQGQISSKIWQQDIDTAVTDVNSSISSLGTKYTELEQDVDGLSTTVANHTLQINTKADNSTVTSISNQVSSLEQNVNGFKSEVSSTYATSESVKSITDNLQSQIDGAVETYTGSAVPTINNQPATDWSEDEKSTHVGDLYIVNSDGGDYAGFYYRFEKVGTTYQWTLLKDNEITKALQDAKEANDKADAVTSNLDSNYSTTSEMNSAISQSASGILSEVSSVYTTKEQLSATNKIATAAKKQLWHSAGGVSGTKGYVGFATITIEGKNQNRPIKFSLINRDTNPSDVEVRFVNSSSTDPALASIRENGDVGVWIEKTDTSTWVVIAKKAEGYDTIYVSDFTNNNASTTVSWTNIQYTELPENATESIKLVGSTVASTIATKSEITQTAENILSTVSSTYSTKTELSSAIDNIDIGGRNLLRNTKILTRDNKYWGGSADKVSIETDTDGFAMATIAADGAYNSYIAYLQDVPYDELLGKQVCMSMYVKSDGITLQPNGFNITLALFNASNTRRRYKGWAFNSQYFNKSDYVSGEWFKLILKVTVPTIDEFTVSNSTEDYVKLGVQIYCNSNNTTYPLSIKKPKLEYGNLATDWTPAPEDIETRVATAESSIEQNAENISLKVSKTDYTGAKVASLINQSAEEVKINAEHITLEGIVTANENFQILADGSMKAVNGTFEGEVYATSLMAKDSLGIEAIIDEQTISTKFEIVKATIYRQELQYQEGILLETGVSTIGYAVNLENSTPALIIDDLAVTGNAQLNEVFASKLMSPMIIATNYQGANLDISNLLVRKGAYIRGEVVIDDFASERGSFTLNNSSYVFDLSSYSSDVIEIIIKSQYGVSYIQLLVGPNSALTVGESKTVWQGPPGTPTISQTGSKQVTFTYSGATAVDFTYKIIKK